MRRLAYWLLILLTGTGSCKNATHEQRIRFSEKHYEYIGDSKIKRPLPDSSFIHPGTKGYDMPLIDLDKDSAMQVVVDREDGQYLGHPSTVLLDNGRTIIAVYPKGHGKGEIVMKKSDDGGITWSGRLPVPENWKTSLEVPTIFKTEATSGQSRFLLFSGLFPIRLAVSENEGMSWTPLLPIGYFGGIVAMSDMIRLTDKRYLTMFHDDDRFILNKSEQNGIMTVYKMLSDDGGLTWSEPEGIIARKDVWPCEPGIIRSPDGGQLLVLLREERRCRNSLAIISDDEGRTWSELFELPSTLTGDRHQAVYLEDGRLLISFRDRPPDNGTPSPTAGDWVGWVGQYEDIIEGNSGQYRIRFKDNKKEFDCAYPALEVLPDGTIVAVTYGHWDEGAEPYILCVRFKIEDLDKRLYLLNS